MSEAPRYKDAPHKNSAENGNQFQDFVVDRMFEMGWIIQVYSSKKWQYDYGESRQYAEIKHDERSRLSGRLSIEIGERTDGNHQWVWSGIYARRDTILYIQGSRATFWVFDVKVLRAWRKAHMPEITMYGADPNVPTIKRFYLPCEEADRLRLVKFEAET